MKRSTEKASRDSYEYSAWLLKPARSREVIIKYSLIILIVVGLTYILL